jgi:hypothetical protein
MPYPNLIGYDEPPFTESRLLSGRKCDVDIVNSNVNPYWIRVITVHIPVNTQIGITLILDDSIVNDQFIANC